MRSGRVVFGGFWRSFSVFDVIGPYAVTLCEHRTWIQTRFPDFNSRWTITYAFDIVICSILEASFESTFPEGGRPEFLITVWAYSKNGGRMIKVDFWSLNLRIWTAKRLIIGFRNAGSTNAWLNSYHEPEVFSCFLFDENRSAKSHNSFGEKSLFDIIISQKRVHETLFRVQ